MGAHGAFHLLTFVEPQESGVHEDTGELITDRLVHEGCRDTGIHTAGESADHLLVANEFANLRNF